MRPDVKLGVVISMVVVLVAGSYFIYSDNKEQPLLVAGGADSLAQPKDADVKQATQSPNPTKQTGGTNKRELKPNRRPRSQNPARMAQRNSKPADTLRANRDRATVPQQKLADARPEQQISVPVTKPVPKEKVGDQQPKTQEPPASTGAVAQLDPTGRQPAASLDDTAAEPTRRATPLTATRPTSSPSRQLAAGGRGDTAVETHRIQSGDTLSALSARYYGSSKYTQFLAESNPNISDPDRLVVGSIVRIPPKPDDAVSTKSPSVPADAAAKQSRAGQAARTYEVKAGDSLYVIARDALGDASRWKELFELNKQALGNDPNRLKVGQVLTLPPN